jgi:hypothetical protein
MPRNPAFDSKVKKFYEEIYSDPDSIFNKYRVGIKQGAVAYTGAFEDLDGMARSNLKKLMERYNQFLPTFKRLKKEGLIDLKEAGELVGLPEQVNEKGRVTSGLRMRVIDAITRKRPSPVATSFLNDVLKKELKLQKIDVGQGQPTYFIKKPTETQIQTLKDYYLVRGSTKGGLADDTIRLVKDFYENDIYKPYTSKGQVIPEELLPGNITVNQAAYAQYKLSQLQDGKVVRGLDIPLNKDAAENYQRLVAKMPFNNPYKMAQTKDAMDAITESLGKNYFTIAGRQTNMDAVRRKIKRIFLKEGIPFYDKKAPVDKRFGVNINEIVGITASSQTPGAAPYSQFINLLEGKVNQGDYALFQKRFQEYLTRLGNETKKTNGNPLKVIREYNKFSTDYINRIKDPLARKTMREVGFPELTLQSPEKVFGKTRLAQLTEQGLDLPGAYKEMGFTIKVPKGTATLKEVAESPEKFIDQASKRLLDQVTAVGARSKSCQLIMNKATGGIATTCAEAIKRDPVGSAEKLAKLDAQSGPLAKVKNVATSILQSPLARGAGRFGALAAAGAATAGVVKKFMNDDPETYLSNEDQQKNLLIDMVTGSLDDTPQKRPDILDYQLPALGAAGVAGTAAVAPSTIEASRSGALGAEKRGIARTAGRTLLRGLGALGTPAGLLATEPLFLAGQVQQGDSLAEIATDPLNYLGAAFVGPVSDYATRGLNPLVAKTMRLGISPTVLKTVSRRFGLPGLALSLGISGYETFDDYRNKRGMFSEE